LHHHFSCLKSDPAPRETLTQPALRWCRRYAVWPGCVPRRATDLASKCSAGLLHMFASSVELFSLNELSTIPFTCAIVKLREFSNKQIRMSFYKECGQGIFLTAGRCPIQWTAAEHWTSLSFLRLFRRREILASCNNNWVFNAHF
jgi:hypothetical protein